MHRAKTSSRRRSIRALALIAGAALIGPLTVIADAAADTGIIVTVPTSIQFPLDGYHPIATPTGVVFGQPYRGMQLVPAANGCLVEIDQIGREYRRFTPPSQSPSSCEPIPATPAAALTIAVVELPMDVYRFVNVPSPGWIRQSGHRLIEFNDCLIWLADDDDAYGRYAPPAAGSSECPQTGPTVTAGFSGLTSGSSVRWKGQNSGGEVYVGPMTSASALPRAEAGNGWNPGSAFAVSMTYDAAAGTMNGTASGTPGVDVTFDFATGGAPGCDPSEWDVIDVLVRDSRSDAGIRFIDVELDGAPLGDFGTIDVVGTPGAQNWTVSDDGFGDGFTLDGIVLVGGAGFVGNEALKVQTTVGCSSP